MDTTLIVGAWRNGLTAVTAALVAEYEKKAKAGFRLLPYEQATLELAIMLDGCDTIAEELLLAEPVAA